MRWWKFVIAPLMVAAMAVAAWPIIAPAGPMFHGTPPDPAHPSIVLGLVKSVVKPAEHLSLTYPEAAVQTADGRLFVANTLGFSVEAIDGEVATSILTSRDNGTARPSIYNDLRLAPDGTLAVLDAGAAEILFIDLDTYDIVRAIAGPAPDAGVGGSVFYYMSSIDFAGENVLVTAAQTQPNGQAQNVQIGRSSVFEWDGAEWVELISAKEAIDDDREGFRDAVYANDGSFVAHIANQLVQVENHKVVGRIEIPGGHGGGALQMENGDWLVGSSTRLIRVADDFSTYEEIVLNASIFNLGHISRAVDGGLVITDTDRQAVFVQDGSDEANVTVYGNATASHKYVSLAVRDGKLLLLDNATPRILEYDPATGETHLVAGTGRQGYDAPKSAKEFNFYVPSAMAVSEAGDVVVTESNYRVARVSNGHVSIVAGDIHAGRPVDGAQASTSLFGGLRGVDYDKLGRLLLVDQGNHTVWAIDQDDELHLIMGTGEKGEWTEDRSANTSALNWPSGVLAREDGSILIADSYNNTVAHVGSDGVVNCFAGRMKGTVYQGFGGYSGDGSAACEAELNTPRQLTQDASGNVYIVDEFNNAIRKVTPEGIISTFAGGRFGYSEDGSAMNLPQDAAVLGDHLYVADTGNSIVWAFPLE
ncbi:hypothetical protein [Devosia sp. Naph2]|uniref:NHL domain-containing protein n=1 Tax=Devosia polycyclovorans TaxID=3345148 RepID=UPI0035D043A0